MALGYTIASILKRNSHVFSNDKVSVKTDWLEQLNRKYVQVLCRSASSLYFVLGSIKYSIFFLIFLQCVGPVAGEILFHVLFRSKCSYCSRRI